MGQGRWKAYLEKGEAKNQSQESVRRVEWEVKKRTVGLSLKGATPFVATGQESSSPVKGSEDAVNTIQVDEIRNEVGLHASAKKILEQKGIVVVNEALAG